MQENKECWFCKTQNWLEAHHVFGGACRKFSTEDQLIVWLCHDCHNEPPLGVHHNKDRAQLLKATAQKRWMEFYGLPVEAFIKRYGKNWLG